MENKIIFSEKSKKRNVFMFFENFLSDSLRVLT